MLDNILINIVVSFIVSAVGLNSMLSGAADRWARELVLYSEGTATGPLPMPDNELWLAILYSSLLSFVIYGIYRTVMLGTLGATLGQAALGLRTVAEGVEDAQTATTLRELEVDTLQGYHFGRPVPARVLEELPAFADQD